MLFVNGRTKLKLILLNPCRIKAASSMTHIAVHYPKSIEMKRLHFIRLYIKLMLDLLMDDDYDIRDFASKLVVNCMSTDIELGLGLGNQTLKISPQDNVVSTVAQILFLQYTANILKCLKMDDDYILDIYKIIVSQWSVSSNDQQDSSSSTIADVEIFDKSEANDFAEPLTVVKDAVYVFTTTFQTNSKVLEHIHSYGNRN